MCMYVCIFMIFIYFFFGIIRINMKSHKMLYAHSRAISLCFSHAPRLHDIANSLPQFEFYSWFCIKCSDFHIYIFAHMSFLLASRFHMKRFSCWKCHKSLKLCKKCHLSLNVLRKSGWSVKYLRYGLLKSLCVCK